MKLQITPREAEVLWFIAKGFSPEQLCSKLFISRNTYKSHMKRIKYKLGAKSVANAVALGYERRFLPPEGWDDV